MEPLKTSTVHRNLDRRPKILGMEMQDVVLVMLLASVMNLIFGATRLGAYITFIPPTIMAIVLLVGKRGRPDKFLVHLIRYHITPGFYSAGENSKYQKQKGARIYDTK